MAVLLERLQQHRLAVLGHNGLAEGRVDAVLDGLAVEIALLRDKPEMMIVPRLPIDGAPYLVEVELPAEDGMPPRDVVFALKMAVERLPGYSRVLAYLGDRDAIERFVDGMQYLHLRAQLGRSEDVLSMSKIRQHTKPPLRAPRLEPARNLSTELNIQHRNA